MIKSYCSSSDVPQCDHCGKVIHGFVRYYIECGRRYHEDCYTVFSRQLDLIFADEQKLLLTRRTKKSR